MRKTLEVARFELAYQLRRPSTFAYFTVLLAICIPFMQMMEQGSRLDGTYFNSPFAVTVMVGFGSMLALLVLAAFAGDAATRDIEIRSDPLFFTSPVGKLPYLVGRFLGAFTLSALVLAALPIGAVVATWMPWVSSGRLGPFNAVAHLAPYVLLALPNALIATAVIFGASLLTRRAMAGYAGAAFLFFFAVVCHKTLAPRLGWDVAKVLDPLGFTSIQAIWQSTTASHANAFVLTLDGPLIASRLLWFTIGLVILSAGLSRFRFAHPIAGRGWSRRAMNAAGLQDSNHGDAIEVPPARRVFDASTRVRQLLAVTARSFRDLHASRVWWIVPLLALLFIQTASQPAWLELGVPGALTTARLLQFIRSDLSILLLLLIALSAGELVWRERAASFDRLSNVTPVPDWLPVVGKYLALAMMIVGTFVIILLCGVGAQSMLGAGGHDLDLYLRILFGLELPEYLLFAALAMFLHVLINQKYVANVLIMVVQPAVRISGVNEPLLLYGDLPAWTYSEISGFGPAIEARLWFTLYFAGWALLLALGARLLWIRGEEQGVRQRLILARRRLGRMPAAVAALAFAIIVGAGGFIFYRTHIANEHLTPAKIEERRAEYERHYGRYASLPQPRITATKQSIELYPERRAATIRGSHRLENRERTPIDAVHVALSPSPETTTVSFDRPGRITHDDRELGYSIYTLDRPLEPGDSLRMDFDLKIETDVFGNHGIPPVTTEASVLIHRPRDGDHWLPVIGYQPVREINSPALRKQYGLPERPPYPRLGDVPVGIEQRGYDAIDLETIIGTATNQIGVAPGEMRRSWTENGRRYVDYATDAPISNAWTITSADYDIRRDEWIDPGSGRVVDIEIFHHPTHTANLQRMIDSARASLDFNSRQFAPYPYGQLRLVEFPTDSSWTQMTAHSGLITFSEGFSFMRPEDDPREIDFMFAVIAHEVGHQWWGHQITPALVQGAPFLAEGLAWYSGMMVVEEALGRDHLTRLLDMMRATYMAPHQPRTTPLLRAVDSLDAYRTGPFAMVALRGAVGDEPVNEALRNLLEKFRPGRPPYPTTLDFYAELKAATPPSSHDLLKDLFEEVTFWEVTATGLEVEQDDGGYRVELRVEAQKLKADSAGVEHAVPMNDPVEVALYDAHGETLYRATHRIRDGIQSIDVTVSRPPASAEVDPDRKLLDRNTKDNVFER